MMKIAVFGDVHANLDALDAVFQHAADQGVLAYWCTGDLTGFGPQPDEVVRRIRGMKAVSVLGDFDRKVLKFEQKKEKWRSSKRPEYFLALQWALENLTEVSKEYLLDLPHTIAFGIGDHRILLGHGSPDSIKDEISLNSGEKRLKQYSSKSGADVILTGKTHQPFCRRVKGVYFINPGNVSNPQDGNLGAQYAILKIDPGSLQKDRKKRLELEVVPHQVEYDYQTTVEKIRSRGLPEAYAQMLLQGKDLAEVLKTPESWEIPGLEDESWWVAPFKSLKNRQADEDQRLEEVIRIAAGYQCNLDHIQQAEHLALRLFDGLQPLHRLGPDERYWLRCASLLHDIGKPQGNKGHHKTALELILNDQDLPFEEQQRKIIGLIARYHRSAWPKEKHDQYVSLPSVLQRKVTILSSILRVADGLDSPRRGNVIDLEVKFSADEITIKCLVNQQAKKEKKRALGKGELMEFAFDRELYIEWHRM